MTIGSGTTDCGVLRFSSVDRSGPGVEKLAMDDGALQHHRARADVMKAAVVIEGEHPRGDHHELESPWRQMEMEIRRSGVGAVDRQIGRDLVEQQGFVVRVEALVRAIVESLRAIGRLVFRVVVVDRWR
jgi:hypothetical protein